MPTYEYECQNGHQFEVVQSIHDESLTECECGSPCERIISGGLCTVFPGQTVGSLADKNRAKMGTYEKDKVDRPYREAIEEKKSRAPIWRPGTTGPNMKLAEKTPEQIKRYIEEGK